MFFLNFVLFTKEVKEGCDFLRIDGKCSGYGFGPLSTTYVNQMLAGPTLP